MSLVVFFLAACVLLVTAWLGRGAGSRAQLVLWVSALLVSAGMFLPMDGLRAVSWSLPDVAHLIAFAWLAMALWMRTDRSTRSIESASRWHQAPSSGTRHRLTENSVAG